MEDTKETAFDAISRNAKQIASIGDAIFHFGELGMQEVESSKLLVQVLRDIGYDVETGISGFPTAFLASYGSGEPVIAMHSEYDAVPGGYQIPGYTAEKKQYVFGAPGHAEGHNTNAAAMVGAAFGLKQAIDKHRLRGTIKLFGAPAEEQLVSRPFFVRDGYFKNVDAVFHMHINPDFMATYGVRSNAMMSVEFEFFGRSAHASSSPWTGISAVDAAKLMDIGWDVLREHLQPTQRSHSVIKHGGNQPNVVPDYAKIWYFFREETAEGARELYKKAKRVAEGACLMTGATYKDTVLSAVWPVWENKVLAEVAQRNIELVGMPAWSDEDQELARRIQEAAGVKQEGLATKIVPLAPAKRSSGSNDSGDISWVVPHVRIHFPANVRGAKNHHWLAAVAPATSIAHKAEVAVAKALAGACIDVMTTPELVSRAKEWFRTELQSMGINYEPLLPAETKPPLHLNVEDMAQFRDRMKQNYLNVTIRFQ